MHDELEVDLRSPANQQLVLQVQALTQQLAERDALICQMQAQIVQSRLQWQQAQQEAQLAHEKMARERQHLRQQHQASERRYAPVNQCVCPPTHPMDPT